MKGLTLAIFACAIFGLVGAVIFAATDVESAHAAQEASAPAAAVARGDTAGAD